MPNIILASSSQYRKALLNSLGIPALCIAPDIDETANDHEAPKETAARLALAKTQAAAKHPDALKLAKAIIIGSDQVACVNGLQLGKPGSHQKAFEQLKLQSGQTVFFHTAVCVQQGTQQYSDLVTTEVVFRHLSDPEIQYYINLDNPLDCAGSFKSEGLGCMLFERVTSDDPSALIGLPLIRTTEFLRRFGINPLQPNSV